MVDSINRADLDLRRNLFSNIVLSGGTTLCKGFGDRLLNEVKKIALKDIKIKIYAPPERKYSTWIGGSILANLATFKKVRCPPLRPFARKRRRWLTCLHLSYSLFADVGDGRGVRRGPRPDPQVQLREVE